MELIPYRESGALPNPSSSFSKDDDVDSLYTEEMRRSNLLVWLEDLEDYTDDVPEIPPAYIIQYPDLLEKGWGWQRLVPYLSSSVDWTRYKVYLKKYFRKNDGEVAALCANKKPDKDKSYFVRANKKREGIASNCKATRAAAQLCINVENDFRWGFQKLLTAEDISLSHKIEESANHVIKSARKSSATAASLVCIAKETEMLFELFENEEVNTGELITFSKMVRQSAFNLMFYKGTESAAAAAGAMLGLAKEAKFARYLLSRVDRCVYLDFSLCDRIRRKTATVLTKILQECQSPGNGDCNGTHASDKSEKPIGTVGDLNCEESGLVEDSNMDTNEYCRKDNNAKVQVSLTINKDEDQERGGGPSQTSE